MILAILNLHVAPMPPIKFGLNLTWGSGADVVSRFSRWPHRRPLAILDSQTELLSNSESLCRSDAFHQSLAQSNLRFGRCCLKNFKMAASWILKRNNFSNSESLCSSNASHQVFPQSNLRFGRCRLKNFKMVTILDIGTERF